MGLTRLQILEREHQRIAASLARRGFSDTEDVPLSAIVESALATLEPPAVLPVEGPQAPYTTEQFHRSGCPAIADDESDYEYLADAGQCVCGALVRAVEELNRAALRVLPHETQEK